MRYRVAVVGLITGLTLTGAAVAETLTVSSKNRVQLFENQTRVLDTRARQQYNHSVRLQPEPFSLSPGYDGPAFTARNSPHIPAALAAARRNGIPEDLFLRLVSQESAWNPRAKSHKGAMGLAQLMPGTARMLRVNAWDPAQNLEGGARYLRKQYDRFGSWRLALAAYNAGPGAVEQHRGVPPFRETQGYIRAILGR
ncbi:MAG: lytic transglycosylase domain-containing protein [Pseudomonadota bacterium]